MRAALALFLMTAPCAAQTLEAAVADPHRSAKFVARDAARHPMPELSFFGLRPDATVVEIWPGGGYWTEILAPYLHDHGHYVAALQGSGFGSQEDASEIKEAASFHDRFPGVPTTTLGADAAAMAPDGSADAVLTFRNLHNWMKQGVAEPILASFFRALKPGGTLGIEEHRSKLTAPQDPRALSGYVRQDYAVALAEHAGFVFDGASDIDANPRDTTDWPAGVWTLPPTFRLGDVDRAKYAAVGEADNFVLKFHKPVH